MKHAFLILAHNNFEVVKSLLRQLDDGDFEIYIHINSKIKDFPKAELEQSVSHAKVHFVKRVPIGYCDYSMLEGVKSLMSTAVQTHHDYYHLISGADMMVKTREDFKRFFDENNGSQFVGFSSAYDENRVKYRNYFVAKCRQKSRIKGLFFIKLRKWLIGAQKFLHIENRVPFEIKKGTDWYSLTHDAVIHILEKEPEFKRYFYRSYCPTEFFAQTLLWNSPFREHLYKFDFGQEDVSAIRAIDWTRGSPYTFRMDDLESLVQSQHAMFARKFDQNVDMDVVRALSNINDKENEI